MRCCDGCCADATHFLCDECLGEDERDLLRAEVERLAKESADARALLADSPTAAARQVSAALRERDEARAEVERLRLALRGLLRELEDYEHHPEECPRSSACEEPGEQGCRRCKSYDCPECECGLSETLRAMAAAREALAWSGAR